MWRAVLVHGPSMAPTLRHGDAVLVRGVCPSAHLRVARGWVCPSAHLRVARGWVCPSAHLRVARGCGRPVRPGDIVVARFESRPELLVIKRAVREEPAGWWLEGDSPVVADDSRAYGFARVEGRVVLRYWPQPRLL